MDGLRFTWDRRKNLANQKKHGVSFDEAKTVFYDDYARLVSDPEHSDDEDRFVLLGFSGQARLLIVCHCYSEQQQEIRIISARIASKTEQKIYEAYRNER